VTLGFDELDARIRSAVEAVAATDPNPTDPFRGLYISDEQALSLAGAGAADGLDERLAEAARRLSLSPLETAVLAVAAAPQLDPRYGRLYAYLQDDVTRKLATPRLVARLLGDEQTRQADVLATLGADEALRATGALRLLEAGTPVPLAERQLEVAPPLAGVLLGAALQRDEHDGRIRRVRIPGHDMGRDAVVAELRDILARPTTLPILVVGSDAAALVATALARPLVVVDAGDAADAEVASRARLVAALEGATLAFDGIDDLEPGDRRRVLAALDALPERPLLFARARRAVAALGERTALVIDAPVPNFGERRSAWEALSGADAAGDVSAKFRLSMGQIAEAAEVARLAAQQAGSEVPGPAELDLGARRASSTRLGELAVRLEPAFGWSDLVVPDRQRELLASISAYLRHRDLVLSEWGYDRTVGRSQGLKVLFAGESGTGKTMAAQVLARELGLELFRIDLATIVSKYIGETEKNLDRVFLAADGSNAILFFDEADALFGKRSEVRDSHDRYANIEVAYLLQKMESYPGAVILATNFRQNIDDAFLRRLDFVVDFPFPEAEDRERIWQLVLPDAAPVADDVDPRFLAAQFKLSGGSIRNASVAAAFLAADEGAAIEMRHLVKGVAVEYGKLGRLTLETDFERFHELIRPRADGGG
jgi:ATPase family associated with various cellular activities (AAA)/Winged helix domain, variant